MLRYSDAVCTAGVSGGGSTIGVNGLENDEREFTLVSHHRNWT